MGNLELLSLRNYNLEIGCIFMAVIYRALFTLVLDFSVPFDLKYISKESSEIELFVLEVFASCVYRCHK